MSVVTLSEEVFACYRRSCAPPPVGKGGSNKGGARGGDKARREGIAKAKAAGVYSSKKRFGKSDEENDAMTHAAVQRAGKIAVAKHNIRLTGKARSKKAPNEFETAETTYDKYRALQAENRRKRGR